MCELCIIRLLLSDNKTINNIWSDLCQQFPKKLIHILKFSLLKFYHSMGRREIYIFSTNARVYWFFSLSLLYAFCQLNMRALVSSHHVKLQKLLAYIHLGLTTFCFYKTDKSGEEREKLLRCFINLTRYQSRKEEKFYFRVAFLNH